jgi:hypothetical protein
MRSRRDFLKSFGMEDDESLDLLVDCLSSGGEEVSSFSSSLPLPLLVSDALYKSSNELLLRRRDFLSAWVLLTLCFKALP